MDLSRYRGLFIIEAREQLARMTSLLTGDASVEPSSVPELFRAAHSVKGMAATMGYQHIVDLRSELEGAASALQTGPGNVGPALTALLKRSKDQEERLGAVEDPYRADTAGTQTSETERVGSSAIVVAAVPGASSEDLRLLAFQARDKVKSGIVVLGTERGGKAQLVAVVSSDLVGQGVSARSVIAGPAGVVGGGGGGDDEVAQAGGPNGENLSEALSAAGDELRTLLTDL